MVITPFWLLTDDDMLAEKQKDINAVDVPLRTRRALSPHTLYSDCALLVLNGTSLNSDLMPF